MLLLQLDKFLKRFSLLGQTSTHLLDFFELLQLGLFQRRLLLFSLVELLQLQFSSFPALIASFPPFQFFFFLFNLGLFESFGSLADLLLDGHKAVRVCRPVAILISFPVEKAVGRPIQRLFDAQLLLQRDL